MAQKNFIDDGSITELVDITTGDLPFNHTFDEWLSWEDNIGGTDTVPVLDNGRAYHNNVPAGATKESTTQRATAGFVGDFVIEFDMQPTVLGGDDGARVGCYFWLNPIGGTNQGDVSIGLKRNGATWYYSLEIRGNASTGSPVLVNSLTPLAAAATANVRYRLTRSGTIFTAEYDIGAGFVQYSTYDYTTLTTDNNTYFHLRTTAGTSEVSVYFDDFTIVSADAFWGNWVQRVPKDVKFYDTFEGTGPEAPTENWWLAQGTTVGQVINDKLTFHDTVQSQYGGVKSEFLLLGDFDIQVDIGLALDAAINTSAYTRLQIRLDDTFDNRLQIHKRISNTPDDDWVVEYNLEGVWQTGVVEEDTSPTGTARIEKIGTTLNIYLNTGSGESLIDTRTTAYATSRVVLDCGTAGSGSTSTFTNFVINSADKIVWPGGILKYYDGTNWNPTVINAYDGTSWSDQILKRYISNEELILHSTFTDTNDTLTENVAMEVGSNPAGGPTKTFGSSTYYTEVHNGVITANAVGSGLSQGYDTFPVAAGYQSLKWFDLSCDVKGNTGWGNSGGVRFSNGVGIKYHQNTAELRVYTPDGSDALVSCPVWTNLNYNKLQVTYDGANVNYYVNDSLFHSIPWTAALTTTAIEVNLTADPTIPDVLGYDNLSLTADISVRSFEYVGNV